MESRRAGDVPWACGVAPGLEAVGVFVAVVFPTGGCPVAGVGSASMAVRLEVVDLTLADRYVAAGPETLGGGELGGQAG